MLLLPDTRGCTVITDSGFNTYMGVPHEIIKRLFFQERIIDNTTSIIAPTRKEVCVLMGNPIADIYCKILKQFYVKPIQIFNATTETIFKGGGKWKD